jgi:GDP-4-dehydro-6-deoxy-D-mannose reductase
VGSTTALVSGGAGFVGRHLLEHLKAQALQPVAPAKEELDFCDRDAVRKLIADIAPTAVFHLAAFSSPSLSWQRPAEAMLRNVEMTLNVLEGVRQEAPDATVVLIGSGQEYGDLDELPATEDMPLRPDNPYAVSKASGDMLGHQYAEGYGMRVVRMRPFNHAGPRQSEEYVISSIARQIAEAETDGREECVLRTGNPNSARDFTDVRDVVRAYVFAASLERGAFNVCRGRATSVSELIEMATACAKVSVRHEVDLSLLRTNETAVVYGSPGRITDACGWLPEIPLEQTVRDTVEWWRGQLHPSARQRARSGHS